VERCSEKPRGLGKIVRNFIDGEFRSLINFQLENSLSAVPRKVLMVYSNYKLRWFLVKNNLNPVTTN